jgi:hypothetical protein
LGHGETGPGIHNLGRWQFHVQTDYHWKNRPRSPWVTYSVAHGGKINSKTRWLTAQQDLSDFKHRQRGKKAVDSKLMAKL